MLSTYIRPRYVLFTLLLIFVPMLDAITDLQGGIIDSLPFGASFIVHLVMLGRATIAVMALHWVVSWIFDTDKLDVVKMANENPGQSGLYMVAVGLFAIAFAIVVSSVLSI